MVGLEAFGRGSEGFGEMVELEASGERNAEGIEEH